MTTLVYCISLALLLHSASAFGYHGDIVSLGIRVEVQTDSDFIAALQDDSIDRIVLMGDMKLGREWDSAETGFPLHIRRNVTIKSSLRANAFACLDFRYLSGKLLLDPGVWLTIYRLRLRGLTASSAPSFPFVALSAGGNVLFHECLLHRLSCLPMDLVHKSIQASAASLAGGASAPTVPAAVARTSVSLPGGEASSGSAGSNIVKLTAAASGPPLSTELLHNYCFRTVSGGRECRPQALLLHSYAYVARRRAGGAAGTGGFTLLAENTTLVCDHPVSEQCVQEKGPEFCVGREVARRLQQQQDRRSLRTLLVAAAGTAAALAVGWWAVRLHRATGQRQQPPTPEAISPPPVPFLAFPPHVSDFFAPACFLLPPASPSQRRAASDPASSAAAAAARAAAPLRRGVSRQLSDFSAAIATAAAAAAAAAAEAGSFAARSGTAGMAAAAAGRHRRPVRMSVSTGAVLGVPSAPSGSPEQGGGAGGAAAAGVKGRDVGFARSTGSPSFSRASSRFSERPLPPAALVSARGFCSQCSRGPSALSSLATEGAVADASDCADMDYSEGGEAAIVATAAVAAAALAAAALATAHPALGAVPCDGDGERDDDGGGGCAAPTPVGVQQLHQPGLLQAGSGPLPARTQALSLGPGPGPAAELGRLLERCEVLSPSEDSGLSSSSRTCPAAETQERIQHIRRSIYEATAPSRDVYDNLEVTELLGSGTFGKVFKGLWNGIQVAVKLMVFPTALSGTSQLERMAAMEAAISSSLSHPNIVQTYTWRVTPLLDERPVLQGPIALPAGPKRGVFVSAPAELPSSVRNCDDDDVSGLPHSPISASGDALGGGLGSLPSGTTDGRVDSATDGSEGMPAAGAEGNGLPLGAADECCERGLGAAAEPERPTQQPKQRQSQHSAQPACRLSTHASGKLQPDGGGTDDGGDQPYAPAAAHCSSPRRPPISSWAAAAPAAPAPAPFSPTRQAALVGGGFELCLLLELCDYGSLRDHLARGGFRRRPRPREYDPAEHGSSAVEYGSESVDYGGMLEVAMDVARAMSYLHSKNIVHSDLKSRNVLLKSISGSPASTGRRCSLIAKVSDFGLALRMDHDASHMSNVFQGTAAFMAPELLLYGRVSKASDVYSFGILLWELYTCGEAFKSVPKALLAARVVEGLRPEFPPEAPLEYVRLASRCWAHIPVDRPTFDLVVRELTRMRAVLYGDRLPPSSPQHASVTAQIRRNVSYSQQQQQRAARTAGTATTAAALAQVTSQRVSLAGGAPSRTALDDDVIPVAAAAAAPATAGANGAPACGSSESGPNDGAGKPRPLPLLTGTLPYQKQQHHHQDLPNFNPTSRHYEGHNDTVGGDESAPAGCRSPRPGGDSPETTAGDDPSLPSQPSIDPYLQRLLDANLLVVGGSEGGSTLAAL